MVNKSTIVRSSTFLLLALAMLLLSAFFVLSDVSPVHAGVTDSEGPECLYVIPLTGAARIKILYRDQDSGLASLVPNLHKNVMPTVYDPWNPGTTGIVVSTNGVTDDTANARVSVWATDMAGNATHCVGNYYAP